MTYLCGCGQYFRFIRSNRRSRLWRCAMTYVLEVANDNGCGAHE